MTVEIIAEIGVNHQNDLDQAKRLIDAAKDAGATIAKFQASTVVGEISRRYAPEHYDMIASVVPSFGFLGLAKLHCDDVGIEFLCTPAEVESLNFLVGIDMKRIKIGSDNLTNPIMLEAAKATDRPLIISTGMATLAEVDAIFGYQTGVLFAEEHRVTLLHCGSAYPLPFDQANLRALHEIGYLGRTAMNMTGCKIGWSDHTPSVTLAAVAVGLGAVMIEKHITLDVDAPGPDHRASLLPLQFAMMVAGIREAEQALGDGVKRPQPSEMENRRLMRKSIVASRPIKAGDRFSTVNLTAKRPGTGRSPMDVIKLFGTKATRDYEEDEMIE